MITAGQSIGNYRVLSKIGTGGMGAVYVAEHPLIGKKVALKVIHRELANNKEVVQRFFQEAKAVNKIGNEHIVEIHDFGVTPEGDHFYIMEYLEGSTLAQVLARHRVLDCVRALHIAAQVASALGAAHASGVIHRDLKPDNVMLTTRLGDPDFVKLLDFGLAKMFASGPSAVKTAAGVLLGTPQYMSPEACESRPGLDHRTDIYAVGILLFQMITGQLPFDGESMGEVLVKQVTQLPPPPRALNAQIPPSVEQIVLRCLMKQPDARFPTMASLREALLDPERYLGQSPPIAPARSLAPGAAKVDAKTVMAYAAEQQRTKILGGSAAPGSPGGPPLPLPAPAPTNPGKASVQTMISDGTLVPPRAAPPRPGPDLAAVAQPKMNTMRIATPLGYSSRPPRKVWPIVLVLGLVLGLGGGAFAVAWFGRDGGEAAAAGDAGPAGGSAKLVAAGSASAPAVTVKPIVKPPSPPPTPVAAGSGSAVHTASVEIDSEPTGADLYGPDKKLVGKTPQKLTLEVSDLPLTFELHMAGYRKKTKQLLVSGNLVVSVPLERAPVVHGTTHKDTSNNKDNENSLMRPDDL
ncbi:MAG: serine/threonine-protein kinase [Acidobacteriota bacterium]